MKGNSLLAIFFGVSLILVILINHKVTKHEHLIVPNKYKKGIETSYDTYCITDSVQVLNGEHKKTVRSMEYFKQ